ncbi:MAG: S1/P1 nuclease [Zoogloea sp.]|nr:S1/P1 nuclease [Zoogloea sp.]
MPRHAAAWGGEGHEAIGAIADRLLKGTPAESRVRALLGDIPDLAAAAVWADCAKGYSYCHKAPTPEMVAFADANPQHRQYHYTDVPIDEPHYVDGGVGTTDQDVVQILIQAAGVLRGKAGEGANPHGFSRRQALLLVAHLVGDIHQPLHVGAVYLTRDGRAVDPTPAMLAASDALGTEGGNRLHFDASVLHAYWDSEVVKAVMFYRKVATPGALAGRLLAEHPRPVQVSRDIAADVRSWADGSLRASRRAFHGVGFSTRRSGQPDAGPGSAAGWDITLPAGYRQTASELASEQILLAGKRLAAILSVLLEHTDFEN